jgi:uncharacterized membrane protein YphA (DoxX/SURF4 family)
MIPFLKKYLFDNYLFVVRIWFGSLLTYHGFSIPAKDTVYIICNWILGKSALSPEIIIYLAKGIEWVCALSLIAGLYIRFSCGIIGLIMLFAIVLFSLFHTIDLGGGDLALTRYFFWFSVIFIFYGAGIWSADRLMGEKSVSLKVS